MLQLQRRVPRITPDIRLSSFDGFVNVLVSHWPECFGHLLPHDPTVVDTYLRGGLCLNPQQCIQSTQLIRCYFGLTQPNEVLMRRIAHVDITLGELYQQLCFEANQWSHARLW